MPDEMVETMVSEEIVLSKMCKPSCK